MVFVGICAGGQGTRLNSDIPKQFLLLNGKPVIAYSAEKFLQFEGIDKIFIAVSEDYFEYTRQLFPNKKIEIVKGGQTRSETVEILVRECEKRGGSDDDILITHDAARPFLSNKMISECLEAARECGASGTAVPATDTVLRCENGFVTSAPPRSEMFLAQTPQCFRVGIFNQVWNSLSEEEREWATDICGMFFRAGVNVKIVKGDERCFKITVREDLQRAENLLK